MKSLGFSTGQLEVAFALNFADQGRRPAAAAGLFTTVVSILALCRCVSIAAVDGLTPRIMLLVTMAAIATGCHGWALIEVLRPSQVCCLTWLYSCDHSCS
jgi:hypothetical protein